MLTLNIIKFDENFYKMYIWGDAMGFLYIYDLDSLRALAAALNDFVQEMDKSPQIPEVFRKAFEEDK